jgi:hypothetical protein
MKPDHRPTVANVGRDCLTHPDHGYSLVMASGREWCSHQEHDGNAKTKQTPAFLDKQQAALDALTVGPDAT